MPQTFVALLGRSCGVTLENGNRRQFFTPADLGSIGRIRHTLPRYVAQTTRRTNQRDADLHNWSAPATRYAFRRRLVEKNGSETVDRSYVTGWGVRNPLTHGFGIRKIKSPSDAWPDRFREWLAEMDLAAGI